MKIVKSGLVHGPYDGSPYTVSIDDKGEVHVWASTGSRLQGVYTKRGKIFLLSSNHWSKFTAVSSEALVDCLDTTFSPEIIKPKSDKVRKDRYNSRVMGIQINKKGEVLIRNLVELEEEEFKLSGESPVYGRNRMKSVYKMSDGSMFGVLKNFGQTSNDVPIYSKLEFAISG